MSAFGRFSGDLKAQFNEDGETITLLEDLIFVDDSEKAWIAEKGTVSDGASIPRYLWPIVGSPMKGKYIRPAVIHDKYCDIKIEPWEKVHQMFYEAMRAAGVGDKKAKIMFSAVWRFGPRWGYQQTQNIRNAIKNGIKDDLSETRSNINEMLKIVAFVDSRNPSIERIQGILLKPNIRSSIIDMQVRPSATLNATQNARILMNDLKARSVIHGNKIKSISAGRDIKTYYGLGERHNKPMGYRTR